MLSEESDGDDVHTLAINTHYAKAFEYKKEREELSKLKEKYGSDAEEDDSEDSEEAESEDEDGEELTPAVDAAILRTLARIKRQDPEIYQTEKSIFEEEQKRTAAIKSSRMTKEKSRPITMRQVALESALNATSRSPSPQPLPHVEEQHALRSETIAVFRNAVKNDDDDEFLVPREKTIDEMEEEEEEYREFLAREVGEDLEGLVTIEEDVIGSMEGEKNEVKQKKSKKSKDKGHGKATQETDQEFLMNYILNRGWIDRSANHIPTYKEVTSSSKSKGKLKEESSDEEGHDVKYDDADVDVEDDEEFEEIAERFESSYNFRFEEPDAAIIKGYPRNLPSVVRREDTSRKEARERRKQKKEEELAKKREEVKRLKGLKMKDLRAKLERIGREGGKNIDETKALQDLDLEAEWDPQTHDQHMYDLYGNDDADPEDKPNWDDDIDIEDIVPDTEDQVMSNKKKKSKRKKDKAPFEEIEGVDVDAMDADIQRGSDEEEWDGTEEMRKRKLDEYMDEIYGLDFNDMVGDMPTRFKYTPVQPQSFALTPAEILMATDTELNQYLSVKKYAPYRKENNWDRGRVDRLKDLKQTVTERSHRMGMSGGGSYQDVDGERKKRKGKKERLKMKAAADGAVEEGSNVHVEVDNGDELNGKRKHEKVEETETVQEGTVSGGKKRRRHKKTEQM